MDNQTNGGAVEVVSNETGQNVTLYFKYNPDRSSVTVSNSTMTADFAIQIPVPNDPTTVKVNRINLPLLDGSYITNIMLLIQIPLSHHIIHHKEIFL